MKQHDPLESHQSDASKSINHMHDCIIQVKL